MYDISVQGSNNFFAGGILVHNCVEITLPTKPVTRIDDPDAEIALCILGAINMGNIKKLTDLERPCRTAVFMLDELIDNQEYPMEAARKSTHARRSLGIGVINLAYYLAKNGFNYSDCDPKAFRLIHEFFEAFQYYLIKASVELAKIKGPCSAFDQTKYSKGILPIDTYKKSIDGIVDSTLNYDWEELRADILKHGMRNSTLSAFMPAETSAQISNATNGVEPPRSLISIKGSKQSTARQVVPEILKLKNVYENAFDMPSNEGYIKLIGIITKFTDQSVSANFYYDPEKHGVVVKKSEGASSSETDVKMIPMSTIINDLFLAYKMGLKTGYYSNTNDNRDVDEPLPSSDTTTSDQQSITIIDDDECDSCTI